ncbi:DUF2179 domain-containing protein [Xiashengella succiniciproducens]|jgi:uncharacterized protein YebE (UPF0316 family)|uniref:UPF0316 protein M9189_07475 n=1 Tax=Xiashengella succiniciproducens TaxID=2949635 RepID=A0A9J6ZME6_9BACT|nr:DUF2179 domain-containing protein [Alkaliflexus sp. Ai-910]MDI9539736.1 DUF2179 domain-containing protein [Bacteroidota bacterium]URW78702.1 DUF2179 domain-containing protein [Alkaliflexus sp. Ai-910]
MGFYESVWFTWVLVPLFIFLARVSDVTLGTLRIVFVSKGFKMLAPILGFFEVFIWLIAMTKIIQNLDYWFYYVAYSAGFATGNYVGLILEERLALGFVNIRIITSDFVDTLVSKLTSEGFGVTSMPAMGARSNVNIINCVLRRSDYPIAANIIKETNPKAFYTIEDVRAANQGVFPSRTLMRGNGNFPWRKAK